MANETDTTETDTNELNLTDSVGGSSGITAFELFEFRVSRNPNSRVFQGRLDSNDQVYICMFMYACVYFDIFVYACMHVRCMHNCGG